MTPNEQSDAELGQWAHDLARELWLYPRSLTGHGVRATLDVLRREIPGLERHSVPTGYQAFDWDVPREWNLNRAWIETPDGSTICDTDTHNLHVVGYSTRGVRELQLEALKEHLHTEPGQPDAIPYVTSYYAENWGFCLTENELNSLPEGTYRATVDATLEPGNLDYADLVLPGSTSDEIVFSTYVCHPSMANNELSGVVVATALAKLIQAMPKRRYTYRFVFIPETIGALVYLSKRLDHLKENVVAGFVLTCVGDEKGRGYLPSRWGNTLADRLAKEALASKKTDYHQYNFLERGSDERQYCAPGIDLPFCSVMASKYGTFPEYHTSLDDLEFVTPAGLAASIGIYREIIRLCEERRRPRARTLGEPQLGRRGLYSTLSRKGSSSDARLLVNILAHADGLTDIAEMSARLNVDRDDIERAVALLEEHDLIS